MIHIAPDKPEDIGYIHETNSQVFETDAEARLVDKLIGVVKPFIPLYCQRGWN
ncbi:MAG: hypothetical protein O6849_00890 [Candidatus Dadabacteria bacterium]|nr:hypothetical protein [Candidatus Dadabacteria bacterium]